jgi:hypothetical protein
MKKKTNFYFFLLMQSYDDSKQFPRNFTDSSPTCMDNRLNLGQIGEICSKSVHDSDNFLFFFVFSEDTAE